VLIEAGASPLEIARRLGHRDVRTTLNVYGHLFAAAEDRSTAVLEAAIERVRASSGHPTVTELRPAARSRR
jgi:integrase